VGTLTGRVDSDGHGVYDLTAIGIGTKTIKSAISFPRLKDVNFRLGVIVDRKDQLRDKSVLTMGTLRDIILPDWGGVQIRYRGFRVYPYGDDDWLDIDHDRALRRQNPKAKSSLSCKQTSGRGRETGTTFTGFTSQSRRHSGDWREVCWFRDES